MTDTPEKPQAVRSKTRQQGVGGRTFDLDPDNGQIISALARGLDVLGAFHVGDYQLGNHELAQRTGLPKATVSRITFTLAKSGFLQFDQRQRVYQLGPRSLNLGFVARADNDLRGNLHPLMQRLANETGLNVGLGMRDRDTMLYLDTWEGTALVGLKVYPGFRLPIFTTSMGRAYLAEISSDELNLLLTELEPQMVSSGQTRESVEEEIRHFREFGFSRSFGDWVDDIGTVAVPFSRPERKQVYIISIGGPLYKMQHSVVYEEIGPMLIRFRDNLERHARY